MRFLEVELGFKKREASDFSKSVVCVVTGEGALPRALDETLEKTKVGGNGVLSLTPENSFGFRSSELIKVVNLNFFRREGLNPVPGMVLLFDGVPGRIKSVSGGRAVVDLNPELAGEFLDCSFNVLKEFKSDEEIVTGFGGKLGSVSFRDGSVVVKLNSDVSEGEKEKFKILVGKRSSFKGVVFE